MNKDTNHTHSCEDHSHCHEDHSHCHEDHSHQHCEHCADILKTSTKIDYIELITIIIGVTFLVTTMICNHFFQLPTQFLIFLYLINYLLLGWKVLFTSLKNIKNGHIFDENLLMSIATLAAFAIEAFSEAVAVMLFYKIGEFLEELAVKKSKSNIMNAIDMRPETVTLVSNDYTKLIPAENAKIGDIILIRPGEQIPLDGIVIEGESFLDSSPITGEALPIKITKDSEVLSGCINKNGLVKIRVLKPLSESLITRIIHSVENASNSKPKIDRFITRFAKIYTPIVVILAFIIAIIPSIITSNWYYWIKTAITFLVISCPCALVITVPLAYFAGIGSASKLGILFKGGKSIEALKDINIIALDKTGTLTKGEFTVQKINSFGKYNKDELLIIAASCEINSSHPIAESIVNSAKNKNLKLLNINSLVEHPGKGIEANLIDMNFKPVKVLIGNNKLIPKENIANKNKDLASVFIYIAVNNHVEGEIQISDTLKEESSVLIKTLNDYGFYTTLLTGDNTENAEFIADKLGIKKVYSELMPNEKYNIIRELQNNQKKVMFVGDGINDAPVLAGADVSAAMGSGSDAAIDAADIVYMSNSPMAILQSIKISRHTLHIAKQNIIFALGIKLLIILLGVLGFANIWIAVFADTGVALICILNSIRILWKKFS